ncbi:MAG: UDP-N-acetylmuramoyl-L-alanine--D-glutamate ligase [Oscillospiraceae bacterium]|nr:UDP-N-acetylmuramoyl-L-alanine--D-glutamate ligase [Oscillospiraceae bacterium]
MDLKGYVDSIKDKRICVIGAGISNRPLIKLLLSSGCSVTVCDKRSSEQLNSDDLELIALGAKYKLGEDYLSGLDFDIIFRTPGLMPFDKNLQEAWSRGCIITSEMEVFFSLCPCKTIAVTGSDGKTTTSTLIAELLQAEGFKVHLGGNIGKPLLCEIPFMNRDDYAVLELSSFQLHSMYCRPDVAVITNITPNHLDKHLDYEDYITAKKNIFLNQGADCRLVLNHDDDLCRTFSAESDSDVFWFSLNEKVKKGYWFDGNVIVRIDGQQETPVLNKDDITIPGLHNIANFMTAMCAVDGLVTEETIRKVAIEFRGVEHRLETVRIHNGITFINDSIASSPTRTVAGLKALPVKPVIILGGYDKKLDFAPLGDGVCQYAKAAFITGDTAEKIYAAIMASPYYEENKPDVFIDKDFDSNFQRACEYASIGDTLILSPACASFDRFKNFEERGNHFKKLVMELK